MCFFNPFFLLLSFRIRSCFHCYFFKRRKNVSKKKEERLCSDVKITMGDSYLKNVNSILMFFIPVYLFKGANAFKFNVVVMPLLLSLLETFLSKIHGWRTRFNHIAVQCNKTSYSMKMAVRRERA